MNIVKQFEDSKFLAIMYNWYSDQQLLEHHFYWGLGDDGELYCRCDCFPDRERWIFPPPESR